MAHSEAFHISLACNNRNHNKRGVRNHDGEQHDSAAEAETPEESYDEGEPVENEPEVTFDEDVVSDEQQNNDDFEEPSEDEQSDQGEEAQEEQNND